MKVYLDLLILDNFCADAALLYCAVRTVKGEAKLWRIALSALLGTAPVSYTHLDVYKRQILGQRNALLKERSVSMILETLPVWDAQLCAFAAELVRRREEYICLLYTSIIKMRAQKSHFLQAHPRRSCRLRSRIAAKRQCSHARFAPPLPKNLTSLRFSGALLPQTCGSIRKG